MKKKKCLQLCNKSIISTFDQRNLTDASPSEKTVVMDPLKFNTHYLPGNLCSIFKGDVNFVEMSHEGESDVFFFDRQMAAGRTIPSPPITIAEYLGSQI